jgi:hypothetical protein
MTADFETAYNEILAEFKTAWDTTGFTALWPNVEGQKPPTETAWARVEVIWGVGLQGSLSNQEGKQLQDQTGTVIVQVFTPTGEGLTQNNQLAKIVANAFRRKATPSQVWFRNVRLNRVGPSGNFFQQNVSADFTFTELV